MPDISNFPIQGPIKNPTGEHYELEVALLRGMARNHMQFGGYQKYYALAHRFDRTARRKRWSEDMAKRREEKAEAA